MMTDERGAATVLALALVQVILLVGLLCWSVAALAIVRQRTASVADVAALAAAQALGDPCPQARATAEGNGMRLVSCGMDGPDVVVEIAADAPALVGRGLALLGRSPGDVRAMARAGPP
jgi:secretion/DNA translocation related TadE-like protein